MPRRHPADFSLTNLRLEFKLRKVSQHDRRRRLEVNASIRCVYSSQPSRGLNSEGGDERRRFSNHTGAVVFTVNFSLLRRWCLQEKVTGKRGKPTVVFQT
jgi:hypothetical protein